MALDPTTVEWKSKEHALTYDWRSLATYALGVGAKSDELAFLYEGVEGGMQVLPSFAVIPAHDAVLECLIKTGGDLAMVVHGGQVVRAHRTIPSAGTLKTTAKIRAIYDLKKFAQVIIDTQSSREGDLVYETTWSIIFRGAGGFSGPRPPAEPGPSVPKDTTPSFQREEATTREQALLYRISGDTNPLHADPAFAAKVGFERGPILHGLATFGFLTRAVVQGPCGGDASRLKRIAAQFRKPVWPGETLKMRGYDIGGGTYVLTAEAVERSEAVLGGASADLVVT